MAEFPHQSGSGGLETDPVALAQLEYEEARALSAEASLFDALELEQSDRETADNAEEQRALSAEAGKVAKSGATMTGPLILNADATNNLGAVTLQQTRALIAAIVGAAPEALDTLAELGAALKAAESGNTSALNALTALVETKAAQTALQAEQTRAEGAEATKQAKSATLDLLAALTTTAAGRGLLEQASKAALRSYLELGSAAQSSTSAFAAASHTHTETEVQELVAHLDSLRRGGLPEKMWWAFWPTTTAVWGSGTPVSKQVGGCKFVPYRDLTARGISVRVGTAATLDHQCAALAFNAAGSEILASSGAVNGKMNSSGRQDIDFVEDIKMTAGTTYYVCFQYGTFTEGTAALLTRLDASNVNNLFGTAMGERLVVQFNAGNFPITGALSAAGTASYPMLVRER